MRIVPEIRSVQVAMLGSFNPRIFRPEWFVANEIVGANEAASATIDAVHPDITKFSLDWVNLVVTPDRLSADTSSAPEIRIRDLLVKTFKQYLMHTPVYMLGINLNVHFRVRDFEVRDAIGKKLAPPAPWGEWGETFHGNGSPPTRGGMKSLTMMQSMRDDGLEGNINVTIEPSVRIPDVGIYMTVNDHYTLGRQSDILGADRATGILEDQWDRSLQRSEKIIDHIMALAEQQARNV